MLKNVKLWTTGDWNLLDDVALRDYSINDILVVARVWDKTENGDASSTELYVGLLRGYKVRTHNDAGWLDSVTIERLDSEGGELELSNLDLHFAGGRWFVARIGKAVYEN